MCSTVFLKSHPLGIWLHGWLGALGLAGNMKTVLANAFGTQCYVLLLGKVKCVLHICVYVHVSMFQQHNLVSSDLYNTFADLKKSDKKMSRCLNLQRRIQRSTSIEKISSLKHGSVRKLINCFIHFQPLNPSCYICGSEEAFRYPKSITPSYVPVCCPYLFPSLHLGHSITIILLISTTSRWTSTRPVYSCTQPSAYKLVTHNTSSLCF